MTQQTESSTQPKNRKEELKDGASAEKATKNQRRRQNKKDKVLRDLMDKEDKSL